MNQQLQTSSRTSGGVGDTGRPDEGIGLAAEMYPVITESRFVFRGEVKAYFRIWLVNWLLTILSLSLYSPWAKVRRLRYFYTHTTLADARFDFTGHARVIFIGRLMALGVYMGANSEGFLKGSWLQWVAGLLLFIIYASIPYLLRATYRFKARNTVYRNVRFRFTGTWREAFWVYWGLGALTILSLGFLMPYTIYRHKRYQFNNLHWGQLKFSLALSPWRVYRALIIPVLLLVTLYAILVVGVLQLWSLNIDIHGRAALTEFLLPWCPWLFGMAAIVLLMYWISAAQVFRLCWSNVHLGESRFKTDLSLWRYLGIEYFNLWLIVMSLGLCIPRAIIRIQRYRIQSLSISWADDPALMQAVSQANLKAFAEELNDLVGIDLSL